MTDIIKITKKNKISLIEDSAETLENGRECIQAHLGWCFLSKEYNDMKVEC